MTPSVTSTSPARSARLGCWVAMVAAAVIALALASRSGEHAAAAKALGYALLAATAVSLLLGRLGRRIVALLVAGLAVGIALVVARGEGHRGLWIAAALALVGAVGQFVLAPRWSSAAHRYRREAPTGVPTTDLDVWKAFDAGMDPTSDEFGDNLQARETSPVVSRNTGAVADGPDQEDR